MKFFGEKSANESINELIKNVNKIITRNEFEELEKLEKFKKFKKFKKSKEFVENNVKETTNKRLKDATKSS